MKVKIYLTIFILISLFASGCGKKDYYIYDKGKPSPTGKRKAFSDFEETGIASWYGKDFHGRPTASGEIYNMYGMTAAHKTLPLGTEVNVFNLENNREVKVKINDRGPFVDGRIIDLTYAAAKELGMVNKGIAKVKITISDSPFLYSKGKFNFTKYYAIQMGSFKISQNATNFKNKISKNFKNTYIQSVNFDYGQFNRVLIGDFTDRNSAEKVLKQVEDLGYDAFIIEINK